MYCPQCGRENELDSDVRFCRYCGLELGETKDNLRGFSAVRREGYKFINVSFILAGVLFWIQYSGLIPWTSFWGGNLLLILIFGFIFGLWFMGNWVVDKPAKYVKGKNGQPAELPSDQANALPGSRQQPISKSDLEAPQTAEMTERHAVTDETTRKLSNN